MRLKAHRMRPLSFLFLLGWIYGAGASQITVDRAGESCESDRITVAVSSTSINGCYIRTDPGSRGFDAIYEKEDAAVEGTTYHILGPWDIPRDQIQDFPRDQALMTGRAKIQSWPGMMKACRGERAWDWEGISSPSFVRCEASLTTGKAHSAMLIQGSLRVTCGCEQEQDKDVHVQSAGTGGGDSGGDGGTSGDRTRVGGGVGEAGSSKSRSEKTGLGSFFLGTSSAAVRTSRALEDDVTGEFRRLWLWVIVAGGTAGLIVLCCIGWYIRNPFFCQKNPPADPEAQVEDAAPQAPKTAFQPWGASAPPM